jgi:hypothetical protein
MPNHQGLRALRSFPHDAEPHADRPRIIQGDLVQDECHLEIDPPLSDAPILNFRLDVLNPDALYSVYGLARPAHTFLYGVLDALRGCGADLDHFGDRHDGSFIKSEDDRFEASRR